MKELSYIFDGICTTYVVDEEWMSLFNIFTGTTVNNFFDNPVFFKNVNKSFIIVILTNNRHTRNWN